MKSTRRFVLGAAISITSAGCLRRQFGDDSVNNAYITLGNMTEERKIGTVSRDYGRRNPVRAF